MSYNQREYKPTLLTAATTQVATGKGIFHGIVIGTTAATEIQIADSVGNTGSGTMFIFKASVAEGNYVDIDATFAKGLYVTNSTSGSYTILWTT